MSGTEKQFVTIEKDQLLHIVDSLFDASQMRSMGLINWDEIMLKNATVLTRLIEEAEKQTFVKSRYILPCDVTVAPATTIKKGCELETLLQCIKLRENWTEGTTRLD